jgi:hypothetical protein
LALLADGAPSRAVLDDVRAAWRTARDSGPLARAAVLAHCYLVDAPSAEHILRTLANDKRDPDTAAWAKQFQARLDRGLTLADIKAEMRLVQSGTRVGVDEWTFDQQSIMRDVEYNASLGDAQGVIDRLMQTPDTSKALTNAPVRR